MIYKVIWSDDLGERRFLCVVQAESKTLAYKEAQKAFLLSTDGCAGSVDECYSTSKIIDVSDQTVLLSCFEEVPF